MRNTDLMIFRVYVYPYRVPRSNVTTNNVCGKNLPSTKIAVALPGITANPRQPISYEPPESKDEKHLAVMDSTICRKIAMPPSTMFPAQASLTYPRVVGAYTGIFYR